MVHLPGVKHRAPDALSQHPTGDLQLPQMVLHDDILSIRHETTIPPLNIPIHLMAGECTDDQICLASKEDQLLKSLQHSLHSTHTVSWEEVQTTTSSDDNMLLLLSTIEYGIPEHKHQLPPAIREYHQFQQHLYSSDCVVVYTLPTPCMSISSTCSSPGDISYDSKASGQESRATFKPLEKIAHTATGTHHRRHHCHPGPPSLWHP